MQHVLTAEQLDEQALNWLGKCCRRFPDAARLAEEALELASFLESQQTALRRDAPGVALYLAEIVSKRDGLFVVERRRAPIDRDDSHGIISEESLGRMMGGAFISKPPRAWSRELTEVTKALDTAPATDSQVTKHIGPSGELGELAMRILAELRRGQAVASKSASAVQFLSPTNLDALDRWGRDPGSRHSFTVERRGNNAIFRSNNNDRARIGIRHPNVPSLRLWKELLQEWDSSAPTVE